jgi:uncharacterized integral membrane protein
VSTQHTPEGPQKKSAWTPRRIVLLVVAVYALLVVLANRNQVAVNLLFVKTEASLFVVIVLALAAGFVVGWLFDDLRDRRRRRRESA